MASHGGHWELGGGPWRGRIIWLGRLGASWKEDKQGVRIWGQAESTVRSQLSWLLAHSSSQLCSRLAKSCLSLWVPPTPTHPSSALIASELSLPCLYPICECRVPPAQLGSLEGQELKYLFTLVLSAPLQGWQIGSSVTPCLAPVT